MQYQMSTAPGVAPRPASPVETPKLVPGTPEPPRRRGGLWIGVLLLALIGGAAWWFLGRPATQQQQRSAAVAAVRTVTVRGGDVARTLRLTGTTGAERFSSLLVPQLRGSRAESLREGRTFSSPGATYNITSNSNRSAGSTLAGGSINSGVSTGGGGETQVASTSGQSSGGGSNALRSATSRVSRGGSSGGGSARSSGGGASASSGEGSLGSTANQLIGTGGGGGGGGTSGGGGGASTGGGGRRGGGADEFSTVLQSVAKAGTLVKKGDTVAEFDRQYMLMRLEDYHAAYTQMEASFRKLEAEIGVQKKIRLTNIANAKAALDRAQLDLKTIPVMGQIDTERLKLTAEEAKATYERTQSELKLYEIGYQSQLKTASIELQQAQIELKRAEANADRMVLKAPIDGLVVMQTMFRGGEMVQIQAGDQLYAGMRFMQIVDPSSMIINAAVNQVDAESLRVGAKAKVRFDAFPGLELPATVHAIGAMTRPGGMRAAFVKEIPVILKMDKLDPRVIPDLSVSVDVQLESETQVAAVAPLAAIFQDGASQSPFVYVKSGDGWERREVQLGLTNNLVAAVRSGLRPGEVVAAEVPPAGIRNKGQS